MRTSDRAGSSGVPGRPPRQRTRGAVLLLAAYFVSLTLLVLTGVSIQRTAFESRMAQTAGDLQQAFHIAEGGLDAVVAQIRDDSLPRIADSTTQTAPCVPENGVTSRWAAKCAVTALSNTANTTDPDGIQFQILYSVVSQYDAANGTLNALPHQVNANNNVIEANVPLTTAVVQALAGFKGGMVMNGGFTAEARDWRYKRQRERDLTGRIRAISAGGGIEEVEWYEPITIRGHLRSGQGEWDTFVLNPGVTVEGNVMIGEKASRAETAYDQVIGDNPGTAENEDGWYGVNLYGPDDFWWGDLPGASIAGDVTVKNTPLLPPAPMPAECPSRLATLEVREAYDETRQTQVGNRTITRTISHPAEHLIIREGFEDPHGTGIADITTGDRRVVLCAENVSIEREANVTVRTPTIIYTNGFDSDGSVRTASSMSSKADRGLTIVADGTELVLGDFEGAVYAPTTDIYVGPTTAEEDGRTCGPHGDWTCHSHPPTRKLGFLVADSVTVKGVDIDFGVRNPGENATLYGEPLETPMNLTPSIVMWGVRQQEGIAEISTMPAYWAGWSARRTGQDASSTAGSKPSSTTASTTTTTGTSSSSGGSSGGSTAICTELYRQGYLPPAWFEADRAYARAYIDPPTRAAYLAWAQPLVRQMQRSQVITSLVRPFGLAWAQHMAYVMGASQEDNPLGRWINDVGVPLHRAAGRFLLHQNN